MPLAESSTATQRRRLDAEAARGLEVHVRRRLASRDLLGRHRDREQRIELETTEDGVDQLAVRRRGDREPQPVSGEPPHGLDGARHDRQLDLVAREHPPHDLGR